MVRLAAATTAACMRVTFPRASRRQPRTSSISPGTATDAAARGRGLGTRVGRVCHRPPDEGLAQLRRHFRELLIVRDDSGRKLVFRFYDPRVLSIYLPTCTGAEARQFFGPVRRMAMEGDGRERMAMYEPTPAGTGVEVLSLDEPGPPARPRDVPSGRGAPGAATGG